MYKISKETGVNISKIKDTEIIIQQLHPKPGRLITCEETFYVVPDIYVVQSGKEFVVRMNDDGVPNLKISKYYQNLYKEYQKQGDKVAKDYVEDKLRAAMWLIKSIHNRQRTILKVAEAIVSKQQEFFKKGVTKKRINELGLEYAVAAEYLDKKISLDEMIEKMQNKVRQYAKRQITWFKKEKNVFWFDITKRNRLTKIDNLIIKWYDTPIRKP